MSGTTRGAIFVLAIVMAGCGRREPEHRPPTELRVDVFADTGRAERLRVVPPAVTAPKAAVWLARVRPTRAAPLDAPLPEPTPDSLDLPLASPPALEIDPGLKPPIPRGLATLRVPRGARRGSVDLDVRVAEDGTVSDALWAGGSGDSALVAAAIECATAMRFYPALQAGRPVAVWCRQRFDFGAR